MLKFIFWGAGFILLQTCSHLCERYLISILLLKSVALMLSGVHQYINILMATWRIITLCHFPSPLPRFCWQCSISVRWHLPFFENRWLCGPVLGLTFSLAQERKPYTLHQHHRWFHQSAGTLMHWPAGHYAPWLPKGMSWSLIYTVSVNSWLWWHHH